MKTSVSEIVKFIADERKFVDIRFTDVQAKNITSASLLPSSMTAAEEGMAFDGSSIDGFTIDESDMTLFPDLTLLHRSFPYGKTEH